MKIAFIHNLPSGGGKRSAFEFIKHMVNKHTVDLYYIDPASEEYLDLRKLVSNAIFVRGPKVQSRTETFTSLIPLQRAYRNVARMVNIGDYDLAFVMQCKISNSPFVLKYLRIPSLYFCHEPLSKSLEPHYWAKGGITSLKIAFIKWKVQMDRINACYATLICANSHYSVENIYRSYGVYPRLNKLGVDIEIFHPIDLVREPVVLCVGALTPAKAQDLIIESVSTLTERPAVRFIYNSSSRGFKLYLQQLAKRLNVSVSFDQLVADDDLVIAYNRAALVAYPSHLEPFGFVPLEAMACSTPVVGIAEAGIRESVRHGETGLLTERDPVEFGRAIETLLGNESMRKRMGNHGRQCVIENWTWDQSSAMLEKNMHRAVQGDSRN